MDDCMRPSGRWEECEKEGTAPIDGHRHQHITARCWLEAEEEKRVCLLSLSLPPSVPRAMCSCLETRLQQVTSTDAGGFDGRWSAGGRAILQGGSVVEEWVTDSELRGVVGLEPTAEWSPGRVVYVLSNSLQSSPLRWTSGKSSGELGDQPRARHEVADWRGWP